MLSGQADTDFTFNFALDWTFFLVIACLNHDWILTDPPIQVIWVKTFYGLTLHLSENQSFLDWFPES